MRNRYVGRTVALTLVASLLLGACVANAPASPTSPTQVASPPGPAGELRFALADIPRIMDPMNTDPPGKVALDLIFDHLVGLTPDGTKFSKDTGIAQNWSSSDLKTWVFEIRRGVKFQDGSDLVAEDVKFSIDRVIGDHKPTSYAPWFRSNVESVRVDSPTQVSVVLKTPSFALPYYLSGLFGTEGSIVPKAYVERIGNDAFEQKPIGSGPYRLKDHQPGVSIELEPTPNPNVFHGRARYAKISFKLVPEEASRIALLESGGAEIVDISPEAVPALTAKNFKVREKQGSNNVGLIITEQWKDTPVANQKIRQALNLAINRQEILKTLFGGMGTLAGVYPVGSLAIGYKQLQPYPFDQTRAKQLLTEANYKGEQITLNAFVLPGYAMLPRLAEAVQGFWREIGVNVSLVPVDFPAFRTKWVGFQLNGAIAPTAIANRQLGLAVYEVQFHSQGPATYAHDPQLDAIIEDLRKAVDEKTYGELSQKANQYVYDHYMSIPLLELGALFASSPKIEKWELGAGQYDINVRSLTNQ